ncbi:hypothetical protein EYS14_13510 [Alteromonadaceae bacterium M269]|nr:hypothetical protein EYS14_13510 [Alteromonadaceae bacterium M269]
MTRYYDDPPPSLGDFTIPKGKRPNIQFNERITLESGEIIRNPIGLSYSPVPLAQPLESDTHLGVIEVVNLPEGYTGQPRMPRGYQPPLSSTVKQSMDGCVSQH